MLLEMQLLITGSFSSISIRYVKVQAEFLQYLFLRLHSILKSLPKSNCSPFGENKTYISLKCYTWSAKQPYF